jgi:hypothetical protein
MVGVGAIVGTLSGGNTNAARSPDIIPTGTIADGASGAVSAALDPSEQNRLTEPTPSDATQSNTTTVAMTIRRPPQADEPAPAAVIAMRFPSHWQQQRQAARVVADDNDAPQALAYAAEPQDSEPVRPAAASSFQLASIDPAPVPVPMPKRMAKPTQPKPAVLFNDGQLAAIKARLKLSRDQESYWPPVEQALRAISWKLATQQNSKRPLVRGSQASMIDPNSAEVARLKSAAFPLIMSMREDQKREVRQLAHTMGLSQVASMF